MERTYEGKHLRLLNRITVIPLILVCSLAVLLATFQQKIFQNDHLINRTDKAIKEVRQTQRLLLIMESSYNSYVVTRRKEFLKQYQGARDELPQTFAQLEHTIKDTGGETQFIGLKEAFTKWLVHSESLFGKTFAEGVSIFESPYFQKKGMLLMNELRNSFDEFVNRQIIIRNKQLAYAEKIRQNYLIYGMALMIAVAIFLSWFFRKELKKAFQQYENQALELEGSRNELSKTLAIKDLALSSRDDFISIASHELNTPLQSLKLQVQMFKRDLSKNGKSELPPEKLQRFLNREEAQIDRLAHLVQDMLEITKLGRGNLDIKKEVVPLNELIRNIIEKVADAFENSGSVIRLNLEDDLKGYWDRDRTEQILLNLINNAIQYGEGKPITISTSQESGWARIVVADEGMGISSDAQERIFNRFERNISASEISGMGLGLFITRQLVDLHGGHVWVESEGPGLGSKFIVEMPMNTNQNLSETPTRYYEAFETLNEQWQQ